MRFVRVSDKRVQPEMIDVAVSMMISLKHICMFHKQAKVSPFELWILSSLEWRINSIQKCVKNIERRMGEISEKVED